MKGRNVLDEKGFITSEGHLHKKKLAQPKSSFRLKENRISSKEKFWSLNGKNKQNCYNKLFYSYQGDRFLYKTKFHFFTIRLVVDTQELHE